MNILKNGIIVLLVVVLAGMGIIIQDQRSALGSLDQRMQKLENSVGAVTKTEAQVQKDAANVARPPVITREIVQTQSQDQQLTSSVSAIAPAVVSVVVSANVPQLEIVYQNPFGNDPFFQDFGMRIPTYQQKGTVLQKVGAGTGFLISGSGYILTNKHVVADTTAQYTVLLSNGAQKNAHVVYRDPQHDIAVIKIDGSDYPHVALGDSSMLKLGQSVFAIGNALGEYNNSVSVGIISGLNRDIQASSDTGSETLTGVIQTDAAINPGNSGGPLVTLDGQIIGINVATVAGSSNISFAIPINSVKNIVNSVLQ